MLWICVFIGRDSGSCAKEALSILEIEAAKQQFDLKYPEFLPIDDGQVFDLGGVKLQAYYLPGHTADNAHVYSHK